MKKLFTIILTLLCTGVLAQHQKERLDTSKIQGNALQGPILESPCQGLKNEPTSDLKWKPILVQKVSKHRPQQPDQELIDSIKLAKYPEKIATTDASNTENHLNNVRISPPQMGTNFLGNINNGHSPMDNSIAVSNGGWIISVSNTTIEYDDLSGTNYYYNDIVSFLNDPQITNVCDPVVLYDSGADRFIFFAQECSGNSSNSYLLVCFSQTNNPNDGWYYYKFTGNPLSDNSWFDYPKMAVSNNELYITGNLYDNSSNFNQSVLYTFDKNDGYAGASVTWTYWYNISGNPFTMCPVSYGQQGNYGPGIYLVATKSGGDNEIKLYDLTDDMSGTPSLDYYTVSTSSYSPAANSPQSGTSELLDNGDCRTLSGFYLDGTIHFVFHSDIGSGWNGINYNRLSLNPLANSSSTFGSVGSYDYSYPSVSSFATNSNDKSVMIGFGRVSSSSYPEVRVVNCDHFMDWSSSIQVRQGDSYVSYTPSTERWGDYTGTCRKHNASSPNIWMNGMYGTTSNNWNTWIAEIGTTSDAGLTLKDEQNNMKIFPNPVIESFNLSFDLINGEKINIRIIDSGGNIVKELFSGQAFAGNNIFSFNKSQLSSGIYFVVISSDQKIIANEKIIVGE